MILKIFHSQIGEGLNFKAEVVKKDFQSWMARGFPKGEDWLYVFQSLKRGSLVNWGFFFNIK